MLNDPRLSRIVINPKIMAGKPIIKGTRIPVELIVRMVAQGIPGKKILKEYPHLKRDDIRAALTYAAQVVADEDIFPMNIPAWSSHMKFLVDFDCRMNVLKIVFEFSKPFLKIMRIV